MKLNFFEWLAIILAVIGAINWGLVGLFDFDLVAQIFGIMTGITRLIYSLIGLAGLYSMLVLFKLKE